MEELLKLFANINQKQTLLEDNQTYCLISTRWPKFLEQSIQQKKDLSKIPFFNQELAWPNQKDIIPLASIEGPFLRNDGKNTIDYKCISNEEWEQLIKQIAETEEIPKQYFKFEVISRKDKLVNKFSYINLLPIYEGITQFIQGIQRVQRDWTPQQAIDALELALQDQFLIQVPQKNFIKLYAVQERIDNFSSLIEKCQAKQITLTQLSDSMDKYDETYIIMDIKVLNKDYYFIEQKVPKQIDPIPLDCEELTKNGFSRFEDQNSLTSCILKCYEVIDKYRNFIKQSEEYSKLNTIIQQSYNNYSDITYYNSEDVQYLKEQQVRTSLSRTEKILVQREPVYVQLNHKKTLRQLIEELLPNKKNYYFECSNNYYTEKVNLDRPSNELPLDYIYNLTEANTEEDLIEVTVHKCIMENDGILKTYKNFDVIRRFEISNNLKFFDLHLAIANLYQNVDMDTYKNQIVNKQFELIFKTSQTNNEKCLFCDQKLCNNCIVPFIDKKLQLKIKQVQIYAIYQQIDARLIEQPQFEQQYKLEDFFDFEQQTDETLILDIQQPHPYLLQYPFKIGNYSLEGVIEQISRNNYNCYCKRGDKWILFNDLTEVEISNKLNALKLFYCKID